MARVLITGASGLIGRRLVEARRSQGLDDHFAPRSADVDLLVPGAWMKLLNELRPDVVVHLAWSASAMPNYRHHDDNWRWAEATITAANISVDRGIRFIATGTSVDSSPAGDAYSLSKAATRDELAGRIGAGELTWIRPFYVFDEQRRSPAVLRASLEARSAGRPARLASPRARHDFVHASDVGTAIHALMSAGIVGYVDIGSGELAEVAELVEAFGCQWVADGEVAPDAASDAPADVSRLRAAGWLPRVTDELLGRPS